jgi:hypothetical protein
MDWCSGRISSIKRQQQSSLFEVDWKLAKSLRRAAAAARAALARGLRVVTESAPAAG